MTCKCGFEFSGPEESMNFGIFETIDGHYGIICPKCTAHYIYGKEVTVERGIVREGREQNK